MTKNECEHIKKVLKKIKNPDGDVIKAIAHVDKLLILYKSQRGKIRDSYDYEPY